MGFAPVGGRVRRDSDLGGGLESGKYGLAQQLPAVGDHRRRCDRIAAVRKTVLVPLPLPRRWHERPVRQALSIQELRAESCTCSGRCTSYACFKGGPADGEGMETNGCPLGSHPAHLSDNRNCVLCMTCAQACPNRSVQLRLRPPAADLQVNMHAPGGERGLILVLAGGVTLHHWQRLLG